MLHAWLFGLVSVADVCGTSDTGYGELLSWFAEATCSPTALLPSQGVRWEAVTDTFAKTPMQNGDTTATLLCRFNADDMIESMRAESCGL